MNSSGIGWNSKMKVRNYKNKKARREVGSLNLGLHRVKVLAADCFHRDHDCEMYKMWTSEF